MPIIDLKEAQMPLDEPFGHRGGFVGPDALHEAVLTPEGVQLEVLGHPAHGVDHPAFVEVLEPLLCRRFVVAHQEAAQVLDILEVHPAGLLLDEVDELVLVDWVHDGKQDVSQVGQS